MLVICVLSYAMARSIPDQMQLTMLFSVNNAAPTTVKRLLL